MVVKDLVVVVVVVPESEKDGLIQTDEKSMMEKVHRRSKKKWI